MQPETPGRGTRRSSWWRAADAVRAGEDRPTAHSRYVTLAVVTAIVAAGVVAPLAALRPGSGGANPPSEPATGITAPRPNIVMILTDDQRYDELAHMPVVQSQLVDKGRQLMRYFVVNPLCCPSRADQFTGLYSHSTGMYFNGDNGLGGGFPGFHDRSTEAVWLQRAGYRTGLFGKYLNHYDAGGYVPPGWSIWRALMGANSEYYDYDVSANGVVQHYGSAPQDYATDVFGSMATDFVRSTPDGKPLFLYYAPPAPHGPTTPPPRYMHALTDLHLPRYPNFDEGDVTDKPAWVRSIPELPRWKIANQQQLRVRTAETLLAVDDALARIIRALAETGRLHDTLFVFTSDNGLSHGEHRLTYKLNPYEESIRVPMVIRWDGQVPAGTSSMHLATNIDLAPTFAAVAGATHPTVEGVSLLPLIVDDRVVRNSFLVEHRYGRFAEDPPTYCEIRTVGWKLIRYATGEVEMYDMRADPYELTNVASSPEFAVTRNELTVQLRKLCQPRPQGMPRF
jgi:arylsulfatase A-like enzyme